MPCSYQLAMADTACFLFMEVLQDLEWYRYCLDKMRRNLVGGWREVVPDE